MSIANSGLSALAHQNANPFGNPVNPVLHGISNFVEDAVIGPFGTTGKYVPDFFNNLGSGVMKFFEGNNGNEPGIFGPSANGSPTAKDYSSSSVAPQTFDYLNADLAKHYGMSKATAYQEALENTSYRRAMADMKAAGLNPSVMFGSGRAHGAGSVGYPSEASSGGGYSRRSGGSSGNGNLFSTSAYGAISAIGGLTGIAVTGRPDGFWIGSQVAQGAMHLLNAFNDR